LDFDGVRVQTDLSYYQKLVNTYRINFQDGTITGNAGDPHRFVLHHKGKERVISLPRIDPAAHMIANFVDAIAGRDRPVTAGRDVVPSIKAISHAYQMARSFEAPWLPRF
jgi:predicted dehydrogenase